LPNGNPAVLVTGTTGIPAAPEIPARGGFDASLARRRHLLSKNSFLWSLGRRPAIRPPFAETADGFSPSNGRPGASAQASAVRNETGSPAFASNINAFGARSAPVINNRQRMGFDRSLRFQSRSTRASQRVGKMFGLVRTNPITAATAFIACFVEPTRLTAALIPP